MSCLVEHMLLVWAACRLQMCQAATDKVSAIQARLSNIHEQQQQAFNELVQVSAATQNTA